MTNPTTKRPRHRMFRRRLEVTLAKIPPEFYPLLLQEAVRLKAEIETIIGGKAKELRQD